MHGNLLPPPLLFSCSGHSMDCFFWFLFSIFFKNFVFNALLQLWNHLAHFLNLRAFRFSPFQDIEANLRCIFVVESWYRSLNIPRDIQGIILAFILILVKEKSSPTFCSTLMTNIRKVTVRLTYHHTLAPCHTTFLFPFVQYPSFVF